MSCVCMYLGKEWLAGWIGPVYLIDYSVVLVVEFTSNEMGLEK